MLLKNGSSGTQVKFLQYGVHILCCSPKSFDGVLGSATEAAVKKDQEECGFYSGSVDGAAGEKTYHAAADFRNRNSLTPEEPPHEKK